MSLLREMDRVLAARDEGLARCDKCKRLMEPEEVCRTSKISSLYVCRNVKDCERASRCEICQSRWLDEGAV